MTSQISKLLPQYTVRADRATGEWVGDVEFVGDVHSIAWTAKEDTDASHYDTYEYDGKTRAVEVIWM